MIKIVKDTNPKLREKCKEVPLPLDEDHQAFIDEMLQYLKLSQNEEYRAKHPECREGVGLAAPQAGRNERMLVISYPTGEENNPLVEYQLVNPKIVSNSIKLAYLRGGEGCLSVDEEHRGRVYRYFKIKVKAYEARLKEEVFIVARGYDAIVLQHEIDHLDGVLFYDHIDKVNPEIDRPNSIAI